MKLNTDRRGSQRHHDRLTFVFHYLQQHVRLETMDLSRDGAMLESPIVFPSGTLMVLEHFGENPGDIGIRLLARVSRVIRSSSGHSSGCGLGVKWVRAYTLGKREALHEFLTEGLGYPESIMDGCTTTAPGMSTVTFQPMETKDFGADNESKAAAAATQMSRFSAAQRGRYRLEVPVMYSLGNMHFRGAVVGLGPSGVGVLAQGSLPFQTGKVTISFPIGEGPHSSKVLLFTEVELIAEAPNSDTTGAFSARILGIDEQDSPGGFRAYLRQMPSKFSAWS